MVGRIFAGKVPNTSALANAVVFWTPPRSSTFRVPTSRHPGTANPARADILAPNGNATHGGSNARARAAMASSPSITRSVPTGYGRPLVGVVLPMVSSYAAVAVFHVSQVTAGATWSHRRVAGTSIHRPPRGSTGPRHWASSHVPAPHVSQVTAGGASSHLGAGAVRQYPDTTRTSSWTPQLRCSSHPSTHRKSSVGAVPAIG